jgi:hypothetical protein
VLFWSITAKLLRVLRGFEETSLRIWRTGNLRAVVREGARMNQNRECIVERSGR